VRREEDLLRGYSDACRAREQAPIRVAGVAGTPSALDELADGRIDALFAEHPVNDWYARRQTDRFDVAWILADEVVRRAIGSRPRADAVSGALKGELPGCTTTAPSRSFSSVGVSTARERFRSPSPDRGSRRSWGVACGCAVFNPVCTPCGCVR
jgi:hypothetical protein